MVLHAFSLLIDKLGDLKFFCNGNPGMGEIKISCFGPQKILKGICIRLYVDVIVKCHHE